MTTVDEWNNNTNNIQKYHFYPNLTFLGIAPTVSKMPNNDNNVDATTTLQFKYASIKARNHDFEARRHEATKARPRDLTTPGTSKERY